MTEVVDSVPFLDLVSVNGVHQHDYEIAWKTVLQHGRFVGGPEVEEFETSFADYCETTSCVGVANGTDALELILAGLGIGPGDEVIVPANTFVATAEAVCAVGARPRFVDVLPDTLLIDPDAVAAAVGPATAAVIAVHLFGQMADLDALIPVAQAAWTGRDRGCRAGARRPATRTARRQRRRRGGLQLLPGQEPGRAGRRWCGRHAGHRPRRPDSAACQPWPSRRGPAPPRPTRMQQPVGHAAGGHADAQTCRPRQRELARRRAMDRYRRQLPTWCQPVTTHPGRRVRAPPRGGPRRGPRGGNRRT